MSKLADLKKPVLDKLKDVHDTLKSTPSQKQYAQALRHETWYLLDTIYESWKGIEKKYTKDPPYPSDVDVIVDDVVKVIGRTEIQNRIKLKKIKRYQLSNMELMKHTAGVVGDRETFDILSRLIYVFKINSGKENK